MGEPTLPSMPSFEETYAQLAELLETEQRRKATDLARFNDLIAAGWAPTPVGGDDEAQAVPPPGPTPFPRRGRVTNSPAEDHTYVQLPQRRSHGGPWGPAMVAKFRRIAAERGQL